jgi:hypothetical protein
MCSQGMIWTIALKACLKNLAADPTLVTFAVEREVATPSSAPVDIQRRVNMPSEMVKSELWFLRSLAGAPMVGSASRENGHDPLVCTDWGSRGWSDLLLCSDRGLRTLRPFCEEVVSEETLLGGHPDPSFCCDETMMISFSMQFGGSNVFSIPYFSNLLSVGLV